jgi:hypothetical protein
VESCAVEILIFSKKVKALYQQIESLLGNLFVLAVETAWNGRKHFRHVNLILKLVDFSPEKLCENLNIGIQLLIPAEQRLKRTTLDTFDAGWYKVLVVVREEGGRLPRWKLECSA